MKRIIILILVILSALGLTISFAANEPLAPDYNWCTDALVWGDGRCDNHDDEGLIACHWEVGWYMPRIENGEIDLLNVASTCFNVRIAEVYKTEDEECKRFLVVLVDSPYLDTDGRAPDLLVEDTNFNGWDQKHKCGLTIHGTDGDNILAGSSGDDIIYGYDGFDILIGDGTESDEDTIAFIEDLLGGLVGGDLPELGALDVCEVECDEPDFGDFGDFGECDPDCDFDLGDFEDLFGGGSDGGGNDVIIAGDGQNIIVGDYLLGVGTGDDTIETGDGFNFIVGDTLAGVGAGNDDITGGDGINIIVGDTVLGLGLGDDTIQGGSCDECGDVGEIDGIEDIGGLLGDNVDVIFGDVIIGLGDGDDTIDGGDGLNIIVGDAGIGVGTGDDDITGGDDTDLIVGDVIIGIGEGDDDIDAGDGDDFVSGDAGIGAGTGDDNINGGGGDDIIVGDSALGVGVGNDNINGGSGNDVIAGDVMSTESLPIIGDGEASGSDTIDGGEDVAGGDETNTAPGDSDADVVTGPGNDGDSTTNVEVDISSGDEAP